MRQFNKLIILLVLTLSFLSCKNSKNNLQAPPRDTMSLSESKVKSTLPPLKAEDVHFNDNVFGEVVTLKGQPLSLKENLNPERIILKDKYLITSNQRKDSIFMIFELPDLKCIASFGVRGIGPDEFIYPNIVETPEDSILFYIYEGINEKVYKVTLKSLKPEYYLTLPKQRADKMIEFTDSKEAFYSSSATQGRMIFKFNKDSVPQANVYKDLAIPGIKGSWTTLIGDLGVNVVNGRIAYAYKYFKRLKIIDMKSGNERNIIFDAKNLDKGLDDFGTLAPTNITHYWGMSSKSEYFWVLYSGRKPVDVYNDNRHNKKYIYVEKFDWNGNPVKKYKLDDWGYFCVDEQNQILYLASTASALTLLKYDLAGN
jgi:hypothetical protein